MSRRKTFTTSSKGLSVDDDVQDFDKVTIPKGEILDELGYFTLNLDLARMAAQVSTVMDNEAADEIFEQCAAGLFKMLEKNGVVIIEGEVQ
jgi:hypothetical protein